jgi:hypothetical protein
VTGENEIACDALESCHGSALSCEKACEWGIGQSNREEAYKVLMANCARVLANRRMYCTYVHLT